MSPNENTSATTQSRDTSDQRPPLTSTTSTHRGLVRHENQDASGSFSCAFGEVFVVADGMGGHKGGSRAASMAIDGFRHCLKTVPSTVSLDEALKHAPPNSSAAQDL